MIRTCPDCGASLAGAAPNRRRCPPCARARLAARRRAIYANDVAARERKAAWRRTAYRDRENARQRDRLAQRRAAGQCAQCGAPAEVRDGRPLTYCEPHSAYHAARHRERRAREREEREGAA